MKNILGTIIVLLFVVLFGSCRGDQQNKLIGSWEQIPFAEPDTNKIVWHFYAGDAVVIYNVIREEKTDSIHYSYNIDGTIFDVFEGANNPKYLPSAGDPRGQYWVDELSDSNFKITKRKHPDGSTDGVYLRFEMVKR